MEKILLNNPWFCEILKQPELDDILLRNLYVYYLTNNNIDKILPIITYNSNISIRMIEWFITNYCKNNTIIYRYNNTNYFNVYFQYKCMLKSYKKKLFDPYCRKQRIPFYYEKDKCIITTIAQLNFFKWALQYDILIYIQNNIDDIKLDLSNNNSSESSDKLKNNNKSNVIKLHNYSIELNFN